MSESIALLDPGFRPQVEAWLGFLQRQGVSYRVTSTRRDIREQASLYADFLAGRRALPAAPPGRSRHEQGCAIDVVFPDAQALAFAVEAGSRFGVRWAGSRDPVHFEPDPPYLCPLYAEPVPILTGFKSTVQTVGGFLVDAVTGRRVAKLQQGGSRTAAVVSRVRRLGPPEAAVARAVPVPPGKIQPFVKKICKS